MIDFLINIDVFLFYFINNNLANPVFDGIMPFITNVQHWFLLYIALFAWLFWKGGKNGRIAAVTLLVTIILSDQINSSLLKELFVRVRPCNALTHVRLLVDGCGGFSMPSSHAVNNFAAATVLAYFFRQYKIVYFSIAIAMAFSRVYVGVHYPFDVLVGALTGFLIGFGILQIVKTFYPSK